MTDQSNSPKHGALASPTPPPGAGDDWTVPQRWSELTQDDHGVWDTLFARQQTMLRGRASAGFEQGLDVLRLSRPGVPDLEELNERLYKRTGWTVVSVPGLVPDDVFFRHLSEKRFPAGNFIRNKDQLDYLEEPDIFHDVFGHVPMLAQPEVAEFTQALGHLGLQSVDHGALHRMARLYWYTVEFGLCCEDAATRIYGAGILSSFGEAKYALDSDQPKRFGFDLKRVLRTNYRTDAFQQNYFVIERFQDVIDTMLRSDLPAIYAELDQLPDYDPGMVDPADRLLAA
ncbi:MAG: phenylalanine 4-monooxygenase [Sphingomicrobium sp.]